MDDHDYDDIEEEISEYYNDEIAYQTQHDMINEFLILLWDLIFVPYIKNRHLTGGILTKLDEYQFSHFCKYYLDNLKDDLILVL